MDIQPFDYTRERKKAVEGLDEKVAMYLLRNKNVSFPKAAKLFNLTVAQIKYIAEKQGVNRTVGRKEAAVV